MRSIQLLTLIAALATSILASASELEDLKLRMKNLEESSQAQTQALTEEIATLKMNFAVPELGNQHFSGLGAAASKVYYSKSALSIGGYGEIIYTDTKSATGTDTTDAYRFVPYIGYRFSEKLVFNSELEFEHGGANTGGAGKGVAAIEFAYLDFFVSESFNVRAGHVLVPVGLINMLHEPTFFLTVQRPDVEKYIIPSTWHENGVLAFGEFSRLSYYAGVVNSGNAANFASSSWIRNSRQKGAEAKAEDFGYVARLDGRSGENLTFGTSFYTGSNAQGNETLGSARASITEFHWTYRYQGLEVLGLLASGSLTDVEKIRTLVAGNPVMGKKVSGYYTIVSYDIARHMKGLGAHSLPLFVSHESYNLHGEVEAGQVADKALEKSITTLGLNYKPHANVAVKANYQFRSNEADTESDKFEVGLGWIF